MSNSVNMNLLSPVLFYQNPIDIYQTQNGSTQVDGVPTEFSSCRGCNKNLNCNDPFSQYQRQKIIQQTVRVLASLYTMNLAALSGYQKPLTTYQLVEQANTPYLAPPRVYWNQMSDRARPAVQVAKTGSGSAYHCSSTRHTITRDRPGAMSPGGVGVDIKHNSYNRYLNKIKGKGPIRRGVIPPNYGQPIPFNRSYPIYGGKVVKTSIINGCDCPDITKSKSDNLIYGPISNAVQDQILSVTYKFNVGDFVWAKKNVYSNSKSKAQIISIQNGLYTIQFTDDQTILVTTENNLTVYFDCNCDFTPSTEEKILANQYKSTSGLELALESENNIWCNALNALAAGEVL